MKHVTHRLFEHDGAFFPQYWNVVEERWMYFRHKGQYLFALSLEEAFILIKDVLETELKAGNAVQYNGPVQFSLYVSIVGDKSTHVPVGFSKAQALRAYEAQRIALQERQGYLALYGLGDTPIKSDTIGNW